MTSDLIREAGQSLFGDRFQSDLARLLGVSDRTVRRWIGGDSAIPYAAWALLCDFGNLGQIWKKD